MSYSGVRCCSMYWRMMLIGAPPQDAAGCSEVGRGPEDPFPVSPRQFGAHLAKAPTGHPFEAVHRRRHRDLGRVVHQQMHMIILPIHLDHSVSKSLHTLAKIVRRSASDASVNT